MAEELKTGTLTGTLDSLNTSFRTFALRLLDLDPATDSGKENIKKLNAAISKFGEVVEKIGTKLGEVVGKDLSNMFDIATRALERFSAKLDTMSPEQIENLVHAIEAIALAGPALIVVGKAISTIGGSIKAVGGLFEWFGGLFSAEGAVGSGLSAFVAACGGVGAALAVVAAAVVVIIGVFTVLKDNWDKIVKSFSDWYEQSGMKENVEKLGSKLGELWKKFEKLHDYFTVLGTEILVTLAPAIVVVMGLFNGLIGALDGIITIVEGVIDIFAGMGEIIVGIFTFDSEKIQAGFSDLWEGIKEIFIGAFSAIWGLLQGFYSGVFSAVTSFLGNLGIAEWFAALPGKIGESLSNVVTGIINWGINMVNKGADATSNFINTVINFIKELPVKVWDWLFNTLNKINSWGTNMVNKGRQFAYDFINNVITFISELPSRIGRALSGAIQRVISWGADMVSRGRQAASDLFNAIINKIREIPGQVFSIGSNIVSGIWNGISSSIGWITSKVQQFASGILNSMKAALGIQSPSTVFRDVIGKNLALGIGVGFEQEIDSVKKDMINSMDDLTKIGDVDDVSYSASFNGKANAGLVNGLLSAMEQGEAQTTINLVVDGKTLAEVMYNPMSRLIQQKGAPLNA